MKPFGQFAAFSAVENPWPEGSRKVHLTFLRKDSIVSNIELQLQCYKLFVTVKMYYSFTYT